MSVRSRMAAVVLIVGASAAHAGVGQPATAPEATRPTQSVVDTVSQAWLAAEWHRYATRFIAPEGRVIDNANGGVSHSEGQGYGMLLAAKVGDAATFDALWRWTSHVLQVRKDGLLAWKWDPDTKAVADTNNATDGDILVAWALQQGAKRFRRPDYAQAGTSLARAIGTHALLQTPSGPVLLPGATGFGAIEQPDGPVINLSYWVFPAFPALKELAPEFDWEAVRRSGLSILSKSRFGAFEVPTDWEALDGGLPRPARNFPADFGYNAIRIPLYLALDGSTNARAALHRFAGSWAQTASTTQLLEADGVAITVPLTQPGYGLVLAMARCVSAGITVPPEMISARSDLYYPETLRILSVIAIQERYAACL